MWQQLLAGIQEGNIKALARSITLIENEQPGYEQFLAALPADRNTEIIGITGPPGAGKSTLTDALIKQMIIEKKRVAVLCVDPSSPFNFGAVLGDRIRMSEWYTHQDVFIRSLATRGAMGGLHPKIIEITEVVKAASFDYIIVETVGVGQSEIEIAGLADVTIVVLVPESGDEVQTMKAGLMEIADLFVVNKSDRPDADIFVKNLRLMLAPAFSRHQAEVPIMKTIAAQQKGIAELFEKIKQVHHENISQKKIWLLTEKAWHLIQQKRMQDMTKEKLKETILQQYNAGNFNLYSFIKQY